MLLQHQESIVPAQGRELPTQLTDVPGQSQLIMLAISHPGTDQLLPQESWSTCCSIAVKTRLAMNAIRQII
jgi:hypothetical protein